MARPILKPWPGPVKEVETMFGEEEFSTCGFRRRTDQANEDEYRSMCPKGPPLLHESQLPRWPAFGISQRVKDVNI
jgi:hypothetical protein